MTGFPPAPAAAVSVTVQVVDCPGASVVALQVRDETGIPVLPPPEVPPVLPPLPLPPPPPLAEPSPENESVLPVWSTASPPVRVAVVLDVPGCNVILTVATTPLVIMLEFIPLATQLNTPTSIAHASDFPAPVKEGPAVAAASSTAERGKVMAQSMAAGSDPEGEEIDRFTVRTPPLLLPGDKVKVSACP